MIYSQLIATGGYLPADILTNDDLAKIMDTSDEWIRARTGITQRHVAADNEDSIDMAYHAAQDALANGDCAVEDIDFIVLATSTPANIFPSNAVQLQARLGCRNIGAFDIEAACSGFVFALATADAYIRSGLAKKVLVVGVDKMTATLDWHDRNTAVLFGDGAGAVILSASETPGIQGTVLHSDGKQNKLLWVPGGLGEAQNDKGMLPSTVQMKGREVFKIAVKSLASLVNELLETCQMQAADIDFLVPHQANLRIIQATADHLDLSMDKVIVTVDKHANTSAASVPLALNHGIRTGKIRKGQNLLLEAFGGGFTWGGSILTY